MRPPDPAPLVVPATHACEIYSIARKNAFLWKWRYRGADGGVEVSVGEYELFLECAAAARASGYEPRSDWTGPCALVAAYRQPRREYAK